MKMGAPVIGLNDSGRRAHPGGRRLARRLRRHLPPQHPRLRRRAPDLRDHGALRGGRRLQPRHHRLQRDGEGHLVHVRDRSRRHPDGHPRGGDQGGAGRGHDPQPPLGGRPLRGRTTTAPASPSSASCCPTCPRTTSRRRPPTATDDPPDREDAGLDTLVPAEPDEALRHEAASSAPWWTTGASSRCTSTSPRTSWWASPASPAAASGSWRTSRRSSPAASTSTPR